MEDRVGTLETGKYADLVVLSRNIFDVDEKELVDVRVDLTVVEGEIAYTSGGGEE